MSDMASSFLRSWHDGLAREDFNALPGLFAGDCQFHSPVMFKPKYGGPLCAGIVEAFYRSVENFEYRKEWIDAEAREIILEFTATIDGKSLSGIDRISLNDDGKAVRFEVMIRPLNALIEVATRMAPKVEALESAA